MSLDPDSVDPDSVVSLESVVLAYPGSSGRPALDGLDLRVRAGTVTGLLGPNGAGKSSTVAVLAGLSRADSGTVSVLGGPPGRLEARRMMHVMLQGDGLPTGARPVEMVRHVAALRGASSTADPLIERLGIATLGRTTIRRLSGGERRRVSLACALVGTPRLVVLDEPTAGLDPRGQAIVSEIVSELREAGTTVLLSTHLLREAESLCDDIAIIDQGRCVAQGSLAELLAGIDAVESVVFETSAHLDLVSLVQALPGECQASEVSPGRYRIDGGSDPRVLATIAAWCGQQGVSPRNLRTGGPSLDDVYWRHTAADGPRSERNAS